MFRTSRTSVLEPPSLNGSPFGSIPDLEASELHA
jgi:hypothetical protein